MSLLPQRPLSWSEAAVWQDVEYGSYAADLPLWEELVAAARERGPAVELGAGSGRVSLALARKGLAMVALERDPELVEELRGRAEGLPVVAREADIAVEELEAAPLAIGPLQVIQLLDGSQRRAALATIARGLAPGGLCALSLVDETTLVERGTGAPAPVRPDMCELEGWVYSSEPLWVQVSDEALRMRRLRERVSPDGNLVRKVHDDVLQRLSPEQLEAEAAESGLKPAGRRTIPSSTYEAGSAVVLLEAT